MSFDRTLRRGGRRRAVSSVSATVVEGADAGRSAGDPAGKPLTVGTAPDNGLVVADRTVSRYHLELTPTDRGIGVEDLQSLNGTFLGTVRLSRAIVPSGTALRIGDTTLRVVEGAVAAADPAPPARVPGMIADSGVMEDVVEQIHKLAASTVSVLVQGETGTGKEVVARALHELGPRRRGPFVVVDCGSLPATLIASELFGHERGAFTGADRTHTGAFARADGGTLFLDEIGELPLAVQPALLGALERRTIRRVGGTEDVQVDVRIVSATHRDLRAGVNADTFRADLYYRLAVARIVLPPLRDRPEDIVPLVRQFVTELTGDPELPFGPATLQALEAHQWSGNVRELRNVVEAAVAMGEVNLDTGPGAGGPAAEGPIVPYKQARQEVLSEFERSYLSRLIDSCGGNASEASRVAKMDRQYLLQLLRRHDLR